jgi:hypothetical protein
MEVKFHAVLTLTAGEDESSASCFRRFTPNNQQIGGKIKRPKGPENTGKKKKKLPGIKPRSSSVQPAILAKTKLTSFAGV